MLYPAGNADPKQQVAPASTNKGVHPPGSALCALLYSYKIDYADYSLSRIFLLLLYIPFKRKVNSSLRIIDIYFAIVIKQYNYEKFFDM